VVSPFTSTTVMYFIDLFCVQKGFLKNHNPLKADCGTKFSDHSEIIFGITDSRSSQPNQDNNST
jgi:hypothetical protein